MTKRRIALAAFAAVLFLTGLAVYASLIPARQLQVEGYSHVRNGLALGEVEHLFGGPPGNFGENGDGGYCMMTCEAYIAPPGSVERIWCNDSTRFEIYFDSENRVVGFHRRGGYSQSPPDGVLVRAWWRLRRALRL
jgi:hypothetical protein